LLRDPTRYDPAHQHSPSAPASARAFMRVAAAGERADGRALTAGEGQRTSSAIGAAAGGGTQAVKPHDLIPIRNASRILLVVMGRPSPGPGPALHRLPILLEAGDRSWAVVDLKYHLDAAREGLGAPAGVKDYLHHVPRRVPLGEFGERRQARVGVARGGGGDAPGAVDGGFEIGFGGGRRVSGAGVFLERLFWPGFGLGFGPGLGGVDDDVFDVLNAFSATGTGNEVFRVGVVDVFVSS